MRGDDGGHGRQDHHWIQRPARSHEEQRRGGGLGSLQQHRALAEVVQHQRGKRQREPRHPDGLYAEVAHVRVEGLAAGHHQEDRAQDDEGVPAVSGEETDRVSGVKRREYRRVHDDPRHPQHRKGDKPDNHHGTEHGANRRRAPRLNQEHANQDGDRDGHDIRLEQVRGNRQAFDGTQDRDGGGDHAVAVEQRRAEQADADQRRAAAP